MGDKLKSFQIRLAFKRILIVVGALFLSISISSGVKSAFAGQDINSLLTNWFNTKKTESINQIDKAITSEKDVLMTELRTAIQAEIKLTEEELAEVTQTEIDIRVNNLRGYADELLENLTVDSSDDKVEITSNLDAIFEQALEQMNDLATATNEEPEQTADDEIGVEGENGD